MKTEIVKIATLNKVNKYCLSDPIDTSKCAELLIKYPFNNFILLDNEMNVIFGFDFIAYFEQENKKEIEVIIINNDKDALILAYNYKEKFFGFNTYEKLIFINKALDFFSISEIYKKTNIDISINKDLKNNLKYIIDSNFKDSLILGKISLKTVLELCKWDENDRELMIKFFSKVSFSKSQQLNIIEMLEEIMFKEKSNIDTIYNKLNIENLIEEEKPQKKIIEKIFSYRFPAYQKESDLWEQNIKKLKLPPNISIAHYPFFEKKDIELKINLQKAEDIQKIVKFLKTL